MWPPECGRPLISAEIENGPDYLCVEAERYANGVMLTPLAQSVRPLP